MALLPAKGREASFARSSQCGSHVGRRPVDLGLNKLQHFSFDLLFNATGTTWDSGDIGTATPVPAEGVFDALRAKLFDGWSEDEIGQKDQPFETLIDSMVKDFHGPNVQLYLLHWDNADDTRFEGLAAVNTSTGEVRVIAVDFPA